MKVAYRPVTCPQIRLLFLIQIWTRGKALLSSGWAEHRLRGRPFFVRAYSSNFKVIGSEIFFLAFVELWSKRAGVSFRIVTETTLRSVMLLELVRWFGLYVSVFEMRCANLGHKVFVDLLEALLSCISENALICGHKASSRGASAQLNMGLLCGHLEHLGSTSSIAKPAPRLVLIWRRILLPIEASRSTNWEVGALVFVFAAHESGLLLEQTFASSGAESSLWVVNGGVFSHDKVRGPAVVHLVCALVLREELAFESDPWHLLFPI